MAIFVADAFPDIDGLFEEEDFAGELGACFFQIMAETVDDGGFAGADVSLDAD